MELVIREQRPNPLLDRTEYRFEVAHVDAATPSVESVRAELAQQLKVPKERLVVEWMRARFGTPVSRGEALVYSSAEALKAVTREHILIRNGLKEKPAAKAPEAPTPVPAPPAASPPPEAPAKTE